MNEGGCVRITQIKIRIGFFPFLIATRSLLTSLRARDRPENPMTHCPFHKSNHLSTSLDTPPWPPTESGHPRWIPNYLSSHDAEPAFHDCLSDAPSSILHGLGLESRLTTFTIPSNPPPTPPPLISFGIERHSVASRHGPFTVSACCKPVHIVLRARIIPAPVRDVEFQNAQSGFLW